MISKVYAVLHAQTEREKDGVLLPDPGHDAQGDKDIEQLRPFMHDLNNVLQRNVRLAVYPITGKRFKEVSKRVRYEFPNATMIRSDGIGDATARVGNLFLLPDGTTVLPSEVHSIYGNPCYEGWMLLRQFQEMALGADVVIFPVSRFMHGLNVPSKSGEVWELDLDQEEGRRIWNGKICWTE